MVIQSDIELPELQRCDAGVPDLVYRRVGLSVTLPGEWDGTYGFASDRADISIGGIGHFCIIGPGLVEFAIAPGAEMSHVSLVMLGSVLATVLQLRGFLTMHASGVEVQGSGVAFLGDKGAGKSSTAAAFIRAGHRLLTDDVMPVDLAGHTAHILPGFPQLKLCDSAALAIPLPGVTTSRIPGMDYVKSRLRLADHFMADRSSARTFYVLARGDALAIQPMAGQAALAALMRNAYHARFGTQVFHGAAAAGLLRLCGAFLSRAAVKLLTIPPALDRLQEVVALVEQDNR